MNILQSKKQLKEKGYCQFNLKELDENIYNALKKYLMCSSEKNIKNALNSIRVDYELFEGTGKFKKINLNETYDSFESASLQKNSIIEDYKNKKINKISQIWFHSSVDNLHRKYNHYFENNFKLKDFINDLFSKIVNSFFDNHSNDDIENLVQFTYYDKDCVLQNHSDGTGTGRICACLIYLNEDYDFKDGGYLVLNNQETVLPTFGNVAIIDLESFDIQHEVNRVTGGIGRYAILSFCKKKGDIFQ